jgi:hypothetical protein
MNTYFNVTGKLRIKNVIFSGVNALATTSFKGAIDLSVIPQLYCTIPNEPNGVLDKETTKAAKMPNNIEKFIKIDKNQTNFTFSCPLYNQDNEALDKPPSEFE